MTQNGSQNLLTCVTYSTCLMNSICHFRGEWQLCSSQWIKWLHSKPNWNYRGNKWTLRFFFFFFFFKFYFIFKLYITVSDLPNIKMNPPQVYMCSPSWTLFPPPSPFHPSGFLTFQTLAEILNRLIQGLFSPSWHFTTLAFKKVWVLLLNHKRPLNWEGMDLGPICK